MKRFSIMSGTLVGLALSAACASLTQPSVDLADDGQSVMVIVSKDEMRRLIKDYRDLQRRTWRLQTTCGREPAEK